jgi:hypothetical protein
VEGTFVLQLFKGDFLPRRASKDSLREIIYQLLVLIIDDNLNTLSDAIHIIKMINVLVVRIIEKADPNNVSWYNLIFICIIHTSSHINHTFLIRIPCSY